MGRMVTEDAMFYLFIFYGVAAVLYGIPIFDSFYPGMVYNDSLKSFVQAPVSAVNYTPFAFANNSHWASVCTTYSSVNPGDAMGLINPLLIVDIVIKYISLFLSVMNPLTMDLMFTPLFGHQWSMIISSVLNLAFVVVIFTMVSGRLRRD
jgi:hypothetical protein